MDSTIPDFAPHIFTVAGAATYIFYLHRGERHFYPWRYVGSVILLLCATTAGIQHIDTQSSIGSAAFQATKLVGLYLSGIYASLLIWRLFLNPLNKFPGHPLAKVTAFHHSYAVGKDLNMFLHLYESHKKWGDFVRIGPNTLSVADPRIVKPALGVHAVCTKAPWYSVEHPSYSMHTSRNKADHDARRRIWSNAFSDKALRGYEQRVLKYNKMLIEQLQSMAGRPVDMSQWFNLWSFDVMGDLAFGKSFGMLESAKTHWAIKLLNDGSDALGFAFPEWFGRLLMAIPGALEKTERFTKFCQQQIESRIAIQGKQEQPDITHFLIEDFNKKSEAAKRAALGSLAQDSKLIIVAGSDTSATTLAFMFYHLAQEPNLVAELRKELDSLLGEDGKVDHSKLQNAKLLSGCIDETLRLHPPVPSGLYRSVPPQGLTIGDTYIPGNTVVQIHLYTMGRDERNYAQADEFIPQRWYSRPELIKNKDAFAPFSLGPYGCIGKNLAYLEIRTLTAMLLRGFDFKLAPGEDGTQLLHSTDHFTVGLKPVNMMVTPRI
ncbi:putative P450 monooxygenase [Sporormia fimetaria CBS 119925]|uniref:P450 monooxygenase n=1 Tax=Sporormia fimetaria CBS 119925 TaxID=1340428 RepID=A0A6A6V7P7_9PLEO|nr:putative P450 monooxygenase [Sporormia fimetaria CBS 119925]